MTGTHDVAGTDRDDWLLQLDDRCGPARQQVIQLVRVLWWTALLDPGRSSVAEDMLTPRPGDWVAEVSVLPSRRDHRDLGVLLAKRVEFGEAAWYIQYGPAAADVCRWTNCQFVKVPGFGETP